MTDSQINFKFAKNWKTFLAWFDGAKKSARDTIAWHIQKEKIEFLYESTVSNILDWKVLWKDYDAWLLLMYKKQDSVRWSEHQRQIETLMLNQIKDLNSEQFILVFKVNGKPKADAQTMSYWEAKRVKMNLEGDSNGVGGNEDIENVTIVNLKTLLKT